MYRNYKKSGSKNKCLYGRLLEKRKEFNRAVKAAKKSFFHTQILNCKCDPRNLWKLIGNLIGKESTKIIDRVNLPGCNVLCEAGQTPDVINNFFATVGNDNYDNSVNTLYQLGPRIDSIFEVFYPITAVRLLEIVKDLNLSLSLSVFPTEWKTARIAVI